ncbi:MAG TPA: L,D-transpeptidase family protein [Sphingomicrobium sp.]|nr:L,D-transpeptidase family protein [Sphingomicrobium sp.]
MTRSILFAASALSLSLAACGVIDTSGENGATAESNAAAADPLASNDDKAAKPAPDDKPRPVMQAQVVLDRLGFTPGVVDGKMGLSTVNAIKGFQESRGMEVTGKLDEPTKQALAEWSHITATRVVVIPAEFANDQYVQIPKDRKEQAKLDRLGYRSLAEKLAERFHTTEEVLIELNPQLVSGGQPTGAEAEGNSAEPAEIDAADAAKTLAIAYKAGMQLRVPNIGADQFDASAVKDPKWAATLRGLGVGTGHPTAAKIEVDKSDQVLRVLDGSGKLIAQYTATMGSEKFPLPIGTWKIQGTGYNPDWGYDPALLANAPKDDPKLTIPAGPNNPIGVVWIDLSKEHYGIHGTDEPNRIGRAESNGCIRLTNWDAARLAQMVKPGIQAVFKA